jgi:hypothetical protein
MATSTEVPPLALRPVLVITAAEALHRRAARDADGTQRLAWVAARLFCVSKDS